MSDIWKTGIGHFQAGRYEDAIPAFTQVCRQFPVGGRSYSTGLGYRHKEEEISHTGLPCSRVPEAWKEQLGPIRRKSNR